MKTIKSLLSLITVSALVTGCVNPPATEIKGAIGNTPFSVKSPKQVTMTDFKLTVKTNGEVMLSIAQLGSTNSPDVIQTTGAAQVAQIKAFGDALSQAVSTAGQAFVSGGTTLALQEAVKAKAASVPAVPSVTTTNK